MKIKIMKTLLSVAVLAAISSSASAAPIGTPANTAIDNTASIDYSVGGTNQTDIYSSPTGNSTPGVPGTAGAPTVADTQTTFVVDKKVDLLVTGATTTNVVPGQTGAADNTEITYTVTNEGNSTENFTLTPSDNFTIGAGDEFNSSACTVVATGPNPATTVLAQPVSIASGDIITATVECDIPPSSATVTNGASSLVDLLAAVTGVTASTGADDPNAMDTVYADGTGTSTDSGDRNAQHSATSTYVISTAALTVQKTEAVTANAIDADSGDLGSFHLPGSTITYTIEVTNTAAEATHLSISDSLPTNLTFVSCALTGDGVVNASAPDLGTALSCANGSPVSTSSFTLPNGSGTATTATLTIVATVN